MWFVGEIPCVETACFGEMCLHLLTLGITQHSFSIHLFRTMDTFVLHNKHLSIKQWEKLREKLNGHKMWGLKGGAGLLGRLRALGGAQFCWSLLCKRALIRDFNGRQKNEHLCFLFDGFTSWSARSCTTRPMIGFLKWEGGTWAEEELWWLVWGMSRCGGNGKEEGNREKNMWPGTSAEHLYEELYPNYVVKLLGGSILFWKQIGWIQFTRAKSSRTIQKKSFWKNRT